MGKNWLIRTKSNHILGPISKEKVLELLQNGSIKADDEVCSGNGYWFYIREDDLVARFLLGREQQTFNPISEAKDVLTHPAKPGVDEEDITLVGGVDLKRLNERTPPKGTYVAPITELRPPSSPDSKKKPEIGPLGKYVAPAKELPPRPIKAKGPKAALRKENYLQYLAVLFFVILLALLWYRKALFRLFKGADVSITLIESVYAQDSVPAEKKK